MENKITKKTIIKTIAFDLVSSFVIATLLVLSMFIFGGYTVTPEPTTASITAMAILIIILFYTIFMVLFMYMAIFLVAVLHVLYQVYWLKIPLDKTKR